MALAATAELTTTWLVAEPILNSGEVTAEAGRFISTAQLTPAQLLAVAGCPSLQTHEP
jgi:hypothetical protein